MVESPAPLPNYTPNAQWGTQSEPIRTMQKPLDPVESMKHLVTFPEFEVSLFASEPDIVKPIWLAWDERGRLWIAETVDYPNNMQPAGKGHDPVGMTRDPWQPIPGPYHHVRMSSRPLSHMSNGGIDWVASSWISEVSASRS